MMLDGERPYKDTVHIDDKTNEQFKTFHDGSPHRNPREITSEAKCACVSLEGDTRKQFKRNFRLYGNLCPSLELLHEKVYEFIGNAIVACMKSIGKLMEVNRNPLQINWDSYETTEKSMRSTVANG